MLFFMLYLLFQGCHWIDAHGSHVPRLLAMAEKLVTVGGAFRNSEV